MGVMTGYHFRAHVVALSLLVVPMSAGIWAQRAPAVVLPKVAIDGAQLLEDMKVLSTDEMQGRRAGTDGGARARAYVIARFKASNIEPFSASYTMEFPLGGRQDGTGANVVGRIAGRRQPARHIVVSAHYDHVGVQGGRVFNGADDNASGTAALFALGKYFSANRPQHTLDLRGL